MQAKEMKKCASKLLIFKFFCNMKYSLIRHCEYSLETLFLSTHYHLRLKKYKNKFSQKYKTIEVCIAQCEATFSQQHTMFKSSRKKRFENNNKNLGLFTLDSGKKKMKTF